MDATPEEWRSVVGFEGFYEVSNIGNVRSVERVIHVGPGGYPRFLRGQPIRPYPCGPGGYPHVILRRNGQRHHRYVHRMVLEAFRGPCPDGFVTCHNDGNHQNNRIDNLRWDTQQSNIFDIVAHGRHAQANKTHCKHGHSFSPENTYINPASGQRSCRTCTREINRRIRSRKVRAR